MQIIEFRKFLGYFFILWIYYNYISFIFQIKLYLNSLFQFFLIIISDNINAELYYVLYIYGVNMNEKHIHKK